MERTSSRQSIFSKVVQIAAARARVAADLKRGVMTPDWIVGLSKEAEPETDLEKLRKEIILRGL